MMEPDQIIERLGTDNPPTVEELSATLTELESAKDGLAAQIRENKDGNLSDLLALKGDYDAIKTAYEAVDGALADARAQAEAILAEVDPADGEPEVEAEVTEPEVEAAAPVAASVVRETMARFRTNPRPVAPAADERDLTSTNTVYTLNGRDRETLTGAEVGKAFTDAHRRFGGNKTVIASIKTELHEDRTLSGDASANERKMLDLFGANPVVPVTAAGGCCSIPEPIYDQPLVGSLARPIADSMDVLNASRGAVQAYPPVCIPDSGADIWTCVQDAAVDPDDPDTWKSCVQVECDEESPTVVEPIYKCLTIGTFQQRFAPEQWEAHLFQTDKLAARLAESRLFGWLRDSATSEHTGFSTGSTYANFIKSLLRGAALIRQDQRLGDAQLLAYGPDWIYTAMVEDTLTRRLNVAEEVEYVKSRVDRVLSEFGIRYIGSQDVADLEAFQYDGALADYPATAPTVLIPAGVAKRLDGGEKNLGIDVVDFDLARQNKVAAFSEFWEGLLVRNCNIKSIDIPIADCDLLCPGETVA